MQAVVYKGAYHVAVEEVPDPRIEDPQDVIIQVTTSNICGSDLHMYEGRTNVEQGKVLGHENMGVITEVGAAVKNFTPGDRVSVPFNVACGTCTNCLHGWTSFCLRANPVEGVDGGAATEGAKEGRIGFDFGRLFQKGLTMGTGQCPVKRFNEHLRDLIIAGRAKPSTIVSHELPLAEAPDAYQKFDKRVDGYTKVLLHPAT